MGMRTGRGARSYNLCGPLDVRHTASRTGEMALPLSRSRSTLDSSTGAPQRPSSRRRARQQARTGRGAPPLDRRSKATVRFDYPSHLHHARCRDPRDRCARGTGCPSKGGAPPRRCSDQRWARSDDDSDGGTRRRAQRRSSTRLRSLSNGVRRHGLHHGSRWREAGGEALCRCRARGPRHVIERMMADVTHAFAQRPRLKLGLVQDGAAEIGISCGTRFARLPRPVVDGGTRRSTTTTRVPGSRRPSSRPLRETRRRATSFVLSGQPPRDGCGGRLADRGGDGGARAAERWPAGSGETPVEPTLTRGSPEISARPHHRPTRSEPSAATKTTRATLATEDEGGDGVGLDAPHASTLRRADRRGEPGRHLARRIGAEYRLRAAPRRLSACGTWELPYVREQPRRTTPSCFRTQALLGVGQNGRRGRWVRPRGYSQSP